MTSAFRASGERLVGVAEIRRMMGRISRQRVDAITRKPSFPAPRGAPAAGRVWAIADVLEWLRIHRPDLNLDATTVDENRPTNPAGLTNQAAADLTLHPPGPGRHGLGACAGQRGQLPTSRSPS